MKFIVEVEVEILDEELLEYINIYMEANDKEPYGSLSDVPKSLILDWCANNYIYFRDEIVEYECDISKVTIEKD